LTKDDLTTQVVDPVSLNTIVSVLLTLPVVQGVILVLENCSSQYCLLTDVNIAHSDINIDKLFTLSKHHGYQ